MSKKEISTAVFVVSTAMRAYSLANGHEPTCLCTPCVALNVCSVLSLAALLVA